MFAPEYLKALRPTSLLIKGNDSLSDNLSDEHDLRSYRVQITLSNTEVENHAMF